jgi:hypothetical protein
MAIQPTSHSYTVFRLSLQRPTSEPYRSFLATSKFELLFTAIAYATDFKGLNRLRKRITGRANTNAHALCMWCDRVNGVDVLLTPNYGDLTMMFQLSIQGSGGGGGVVSEDEENIIYQGVCFGSLMFQ